MKIRLLGRSLVPYRYESLEIRIFELMVHGVEIANPGEEAVTVDAVSLSLEERGRPLVTKTCAGTALDERASIAVAMLEGGLPPEVVFGLCFSRPLGRRAPWSLTRKLPPGGALAIPNTFLATRFASPTRLAVTVRAGGEDFRRTFRIEPFECRNRYVFPLPGRARCFNGPATGVSHHRHTTAQEFGYDVMPVNATGRFARGEGKRNRDFVGWRRPVLAPAAGRVVIALDGLPDQPAPGAPTPPSQEMLERFGLPQILGGNLVVIEHRHGEHSLLAHLGEGTVGVEEGERVKRGRKIGLLGNSGNSSAPHLHYHLMDGPDFLSSRSLPVRFTDIEDGLEGMGGEFESLPAPLIATKE